MYQFIPKSYLDENRDFVATTGPEDLSKWVSRHVRVDFPSISCQTDGVINPKPLIIPLLPSCPPKMFRRLMDYWF